MIPVKVVIAPEAGRVELQTIELDENALPDDRILVKTLYSAVSAGTECAWISGNSNNDIQKFPFRPGYSAVGEVIKVGKAVENFAVGDKVIAPWGGHRSHIVSAAAPGYRGAYKITDSSISLKAAAFTHIASFPMLGVRKLRIQMGESVMIAGLGILGQIAVQAAKYSGGAPVLACDFSPERRELALKLGADAVFDPREPDFAEKVREMTGGGVNAVVEVTGKAAALKQAISYTARMGRISLLGCTRVSDCPLDFYRDLHLTGITLIGAHTQNRPILESRPGEWSAHDDYGTILKFLASGRFDFSSLIHLTVTPEDCTGLYNRLLTEPNPPMGIIFDWNM